MIQLLFTLLVAPRGRGPLEAFLRRAGWKLRAALARFHNPIMRWRLGKFACLIPFSHDLPLILLRYPQYCGFVVRAAKWLQSQEGPCSLIDVGANVGDTCLMTRSETELPILCIEGNPFFFELLCRNTVGIPGVVCRMVLLGAQRTTRSGTLHLTGGTSSIAKGSDLLSTLPLDSVLEDFPEFRCARLLKIDTDGYDFQVLLGAGELLRRARPVLIFEYDPRLLRKAGEPSLGVFAYLRDLGYRYALAYDNFGCLMLTASLLDQILLADLDAYCWEKTDGLYLDFCVFHETDQTLAQGFHAQERAFFQQSRSI